MELRHTALRSGRLSSFLLGELKMSRSLMDKLKWGDAIRVNDRPEHTNYPVSPGDTITVRLDEPAPEYPAEQGDLTILFEDEHLLILDKPPGMLIHPSRSQFTGTLANLVVGHYQATGQNSAFHPVTRLDRDTFGLVLLAKNAHVHTLLQQSDIQKTYEAIVFGAPPTEEGIVDAPIDRRPLPSLLRFIGPEGKPSRTAYRVLEKNELASRLSLTPITGRTHQLRLHCAHMGCPILGDPQYGSDASTALSTQLGLSHQLLCARHLHLTHPLIGTPMHITSSYRLSLRTL